MNKNISFPQWIYEFSLWKGIGMQPCSEKWSGKNNCSSLIDQIHFLYAWNNILTTFNNILSIRKGFFFLLPASWLFFEAQSEAQDKHFFTSPTMLLVKLHLQATQELQNLQHNHSTSEYEEHDWTMRCACSSWIKIQAACVSWKGESGINMYVCLLLGWLQRIVSAMWREAAEELCRTTNPNGKWLQGGLKPTET